MDRRRTAGVALVKRSGEAMVPILYVSHVSVLGGAERSLVAMIEQLDRDAFRPVVACPAGGPLPRRLRELGVETEPVRFTRWKRRSGILAKSAWGVHYLAAVLRLARVARKHRVRVVHANSTSAQLYGAAVGLLLRIPSVWHVRDLVPLGAAGRCLFRLSSLILAPSAAVEEDIRRYGPRRRKRPEAGVISRRPPAGTRAADPQRGPRPLRGLVVRLPNGIDPGEWTPRRFATGPAHDTVRRLRERLGAGDGGCLVGMVAQLVPWKEHRLFIEAAGAVARRSPSVAFVIVGGDLFGDHPGYQERLRGLCGEVHVADRMTFTGNVDDVMPVIAALDVVVLPSRREPFGRVALEAMALEKPVIAADAGGPRDVVVHGVTGLLVTAGDPEGFAGAIAALAADPRRRGEMGRAGRRRVEENFDVGVLTGELESWYDTIA